MKIITLKDIEEANQLIEEFVYKTPMNLSRACSDVIGTNVYLKFENHQLTGSFKIRGAFNKILNLSEKEKSSGVVASSAGNHAQGVALASSKSGVHSTIVMPVNAPMVKVLATKNYGADVILHGDVFDDAYAHAKLLEKEKGYTFVHPYEDPHIIAGQGTIGLELLERFSNLDSVVIGLGGGGIVSGVATAIKTLNPKCKVYGVVTSEFPAMRELYQSQSSFGGGSSVTIADGIAVKNPSQFMYENYISKLVDDVVEVSESEITEAIVFLLERAKTVVEGAGAVGVAAALKGKLSLGENTAILLSGGNIDLNLMSKVIERGLVSSSRLMKFSVLVSDKPGALKLITEVIAENGANILEVHHDRLDVNLGLRQARIQVLVETKDAAHKAEIASALETIGVLLT